MAEQTFETFIASERERLNSDREAIFNQQHELEGKLNDLNRELAAIDAYEAAKAGKPVRSRPMATGQTRTRLSSQGRRGSRRAALLKLIEESEGLTRGEIIQNLGLKGDKSGEMSVSNALTALTKANHVSRREGKYVRA